MGACLSVTYAGQKFYSQDDLDAAYEQGHLDGQHDGFNRGNADRCEEGYENGYTDGSKLEEDEGNLQCDTDNICGEVCNSDCNFCTGNFYLMQSDNNCTAVGEENVRETESDDDIYGEYSK